MAPAPKRLRSNTTDDTGKVSTVQATADRGASAPQASGRSLDQAAARGGANASPSHVMGSATLRAIQRRRRQLTDEIERIDARVFALETQYLDAVAPIPRNTSVAGCPPPPSCLPHFGSLFDGWGPTTIPPPAQVKLEDSPSAGSVAVGSATSQHTTHLNRHPMCSRRFTLSSTTALAACERAGLF